MTTLQQIFFRRPLLNKKNNIHLDWRSLLFFMVHLVALIGPFFVHFSWGLVGLAFILYYARGLMVSISYHRYFSHRTFKTSRVFQFILALLAQTSAQNGVLWWAAHHRMHHRHPDQAGDPHSPKDGIFWSHVGWVLVAQSNNTASVPDFARYPELRWLNQWHFFPALVFIAILYVTTGIAGVIWGFFVSTVMLWHVTFMINSVAHLWGKQRYPTADTSRNNFWLALVAMGEGWHNNHHHYMTSAKLGFFGWEIDPGYYLIRLLVCCRLIWGVRTPPAKQIQT